MARRLSCLLGLETRLSLADLSASSSSPSSALSAVVPLGFLAFCNLAACFRRRRCVWFSLLAFVLFQIALDCFPIFYRLLHVALTLYEVYREPANVAKLLIFPVTAL